MQKLCNNTVLYNPIFPYKDRLSSVLIWWNMRQRKPVFLHIKRNGRIFCLLFLMKMNSLQLIFQIILYGALIKIRLD